MKLPQLEDLGDVSGKNVLVRSDLNVPLKDGVIGDDYRIRQSVPTWQWLVDRGASVTVCAHVGRPKGQADPKYSMAPIEARVQELVPGVRVLENLRFNIGEEQNDPAFVQQLIAGQDFYVDDAFGAAHRKHASVVGPPQFLPSAAGRLLYEEVEVLGGLLEDPTRPFVAVLGGAKVSDKIGVIDALLNKVDTMIIGGGMSYTFLKAMGHQIGDSLLQADQLDYCRKLLDGDKRIVLPTDLVVAPGQSFEGDVDAAGTQIVARDVPDGWEGFDIGPETRVTFAQEVHSARTAFWNGPVGRFEDPRFADGTKSVADAMAKCAGTTVIGGGDVVSAVNSFGLADQMSWVSTGGGAALEFIEQGDLPGLRALRGES